MTQDRPFVGILLMLGFCIMAPMQDTMAKILGSIVPLMTLLFVRFGVQAVVLVGICAATGRDMRFRGRVLWLAWARGALHIAGIAAMFTALRFLPIADAIAIAFVMPFIMLLLGWSVLGEVVGMRRLVACAVGFCGTLMVVQPAFEDVGWPAFLPLIVAVVFALYMLITRIIAKEVDPMALQAVNGVMSTSLLVPLAGLVALAGIPLVPQEPIAGSTALLLLGVGLLGTLAHLLMSWSLRYAPSATLAPMQYLEIPIATFFGWLVFGDLPNGLAALGICVTIAAGIYIIYREQASARQPAAT